MTDLSKTKLTKKQARRYDRLYGRSDGKLVRDFLPNGRSGMFIYAVSVFAHPDKVKVGMTTNWNVRRKAYASWNLSDGSAITCERVFCLTDEFVDLAKLEAHILDRMPMDIAHGKEWFFGTVDDAAREIDRVMCEHGLTYVF